MAEGAQERPDLRVLNVPHARADVDVLAQDLLDLLAGRGLHDEGAAGEGEGGGVV